MKKKIILLHIIDFLQESGGAEKRLLNDICRLNKDLFVNKVICLCNSDEETVCFLRNKGISVHLAGNRSVLNKFFCLIKLIKNIKPDVVHTQLFYSDILGRTAAKLCKVQIIVSTFQSAVHEPNAKFYYSFKRRLLDIFTSRLCTHMIAVSEFVKQSISKRLFVKDKKITVIHNYITEMTNIANKKPMRNLHKMDELKLMCVGKLHPAKGQLELIAAVAELLKEGKIIKLILAGEGPSRKECEDKIAKLGLQNNISLIGNINNVCDLLEQCDAFIFPTHSEGLSLSLLEAVFAKIPCIISSIPSNLEVIHSDQCFTFDYGDVNSICRSLKDFILIFNKNPKKIKAMVNNAYDFAIRKFNPEMCVKNLEELYINLYKNQKNER